MHKETSIRQIGNSLGATFPKEMLDRMHLGKGDKVYIVETAQGLLVTPYDPGFAEAMEIYREGAASYRNALRELAK
jgi:antitoxin MazE